MPYTSADITANQALLVFAGYAAMLATHNQSDFYPILDLHQETFRKSVKTLKSYNGTIKEIHVGIKNAVEVLPQYESFCPGISEILQDTPS
jgi:hypothetical protein